MKTDHSAACEHTLERLEALIDGELTIDEQASVDAHLGGCDACADELLHAKEIKRSLNELPALRCPPGVVTAAERDHRKTLRPTWFGLPRWATASVGIAASLALVALVAEEQPRDPATAEARRAEQALVELQATLQTQATNVGLKTYEHSVAKPTRIVVAAVSESPLGRWSAKAASFFAEPNTTRSDAT
ncbi:MAG: zf-HC2 domain-containing protein [Planctomycetota bacterium]